MKNTLLGILIGTLISPLVAFAIVYPASNSLAPNPQNGYVFTTNGATSSWTSIPGAASTTWGQIIGTLSSQTDLQTALNAKLSTTSAANTYLPITGDVLSWDEGNQALNWAGSYGAPLPELQLTSLGGAPTIEAYNDPLEIIGNNGGITFVSNNGDTGFTGNGGYAVYFDTSNLTNSHNYQFEDKGGTLALTSDLSNYLPLSASTSIPAAGLNTQIQYNNGGLFGASSGLTFSSSTNLLKISASSTGISQLLELQNTSYGLVANQGTELMFGGSAYGSNVYQGGFIRGVINTADTAGDLVFGTGLITASEKMRLAGGTGALLIGTSTDNGLGLLQVNGSSTMSQLYLQGLANSPSFLAVNGSGLVIATTTSQFLTSASLSGYLSTTSAASTYVPYTGATSGVNLNNQYLSNVSTLSVGTTSTSSIVMIQGTTTQNLLTVASSTGKTLFTILANGNVGIGTSTPSSPLTINYDSGSISAPDISIGTGGNADNYISFSGQRGYMGYLSASSTMIIQGGYAGGTPKGISFEVGNGSGTSANWNGGIVAMTILPTSGNVGIGTTTPGTALSVIGTSTTQGLNISNLSNNFLAVDTSGNVISTTTSQFLTAVGITTANGVSGTWLSPNLTISLGAITPTTVNTLTVGTGNGSLTLNTALGLTALGGSNSGAGANTAVGAYSLRINTTGNSNTGIGEGTFYSNDSGSSNTAIGGNTLYYNVSGNYNTAVGKNSLYETLSSNSVGIGFSAGEYATSTSNELFINNQDRSSYTGDITKSLIYGVFNSATSSQSLTINGSLNAYATTISGGLTQTNGTVSLATTSVSQLSTSYGIVPRIIGYTASTSITININNTDVATTTSGGWATTTFANPTGTALDGQMIEIDIINASTTGDGLAFGTSFQGSSLLASTTSGYLPLPTSISSSTLNQLLFQYKAPLSKWIYQGTIIQ